ncbi:MAG: Gfo/Idh/MocA family oxidoreductase [Saprospiraceae bacterium]|nr:Gfo/Idh/MocA family oxidoreductase [Saprospiraceae bacterium]MCB9322288.1 Gfo/Idh/MocA family oxidoreductase [Lewinellaceae bacterium]
MKNFALIGAAGYIAPRHLQAILETSNNLIVALDKNDSVGIMDRYFPQAAFFTEFERFDRHVCKLIRRGDPIDYVSVCTPNYLHDAHIRFGLRVGAHVICEKPLMLTPRNINALRYLEEESSKNIYTILQLRLHPSLLKLKREVEAAPPDKTYDIDLTYITSRGNWYYSSWKGDLEKSGGIATNIGIHFFDMLTWIFGDVKSNIVHIHTHDRAAGYLELEKARVRWFLSINYATIPNEVKNNGMTTYRSLTLDDRKIEFSDGFTDLHTRSYEAILAGNGFGLAEASKAIQIAYHIRNAFPVGLTGEFHPLALLPQSRHPFKPEAYRQESPFQEQDLHHHN